MITEPGGGGPTGATGTLREYIWLPEAGIAPTFASATEIARPLAVVENVETVAPLLWFAGVGPQRNFDSEKHPTYPSTSGLITLAAIGLPSNTLSTLSADCRPMRSTDSVVTPAMCGATMTLGSLSNG